MENSILKSTKATLGLDANYTPFDQDIILHINAVFSVFDQLGVGPEGGFSIEDETAVWTDFIDPASDPTNVYLKSMLNMSKSLMYLKVRMLFDQPNTSYLIASLDRQIADFEWRVRELREAAKTAAEEVV